MKYPKINSLVPAAEHFDESAIINEGGYLSIAHLTAIEKNLADSESGSIASTAALNAAQESLAAATESLTAANTKVEEQTATITSLQSEVATAKTTNETQAARITALEAEVAALGAEESGKGTTIITDPKLENDKSDKKVPSYLDDKNPANAWADKRLKK